MPEFLDLLDPDAALDRFLRAIPECQLRTEIVEVKDSLGRIVAKGITSNEFSPNFSRSTVDGFAVIASDTFGASESMPAYLNLLGEVPMGRQADMSLEPGMTAMIHTGGMLPHKADAVIMIEFTGTSRPGEVEIYKAVAPGENVILKGEDIKPGDHIISKGTLIRAQELGGMLAVGIKMIEVFQKPRISILSSGDELVPPEITPRPGQVRDLNSYTIKALVEKTGGIPIAGGIMPDKINDIRIMMKRAFKECDMLIVTAGSSISTRDFTAQIINELGSPGVLVHGINIRPGKPTILAVCDGKPVVGLPGNPVSAFTIARLFVRPVMDKLQGLSSPRILPQVDSILSINIPSRAGRTDYVPVKLHNRGKRLYAEPIFYKSNLIFSLVRADGIAYVPRDSNGIPAGKKIKVFLLD